MPQTILYRLFFTTLIFLFIENAVTAQLPPYKPDNTYGRGGKRTQRFGGGNDTIYDGNGTAREVTQYHLAIPDYIQSGKKVQYFDCEGHLVYYTFIAEGLNDSNGDPTENYSESVRFENGEIKEGERKKITTEGTTVYERYDPTLGADGKPLGWKIIPNPNRKFPNLRPPLPTPPRNCGKDTRTGCIPKSELSAGYSYLNANLGDNSESLPVGAQADVVIPVSQNLGVVADVSLHTKKENDLRIMKIFLMGGLQYYLFKQQQEQKLRVLARALIGFAMDRQKYSYGPTSNTDKYSAFAFAFGLGLQHPVNRMIAIRVMADYIRTHFNEESQGNLRASLGIKINLGCK
jgi:hypothetical protein